MQPPSPASGLGGQIGGFGGLKLTAGIWLIIATCVLRPNSRDSRWNDVVFGTIIGVFVFVRATGVYQTNLLSLINAVIGVWLFVAVFIIDHATVAGRKDIILGISVCPLRLSSAEATANLFPPWVRHAAYRSLATSEGTAFT